MSTIHAQAPDGETKPVGFRLKSGVEAMTIYQDFYGQPNPNARFLLDDAYYFKVLNETADACMESSLHGSTFAKIYVPSKEEQELSDTDWDKMTNHRPVRSDGNTNCPPFEFPRISLSQIKIPEKELGKVYWIEVSKLYEDGGEAISTENIRANYFEDAQVRSRFFVAALAIPFKFRFSFKEPHTSFTGESSLSAAVGWTFARDRDFDNRAWLMLAGGLTFINPNTPFDDAGSEKQKNIPGATACIGIGVNIKQTQAGLVFGYDFADSNWEFNAKPWASLSVGFSLLNPKGKTPGN